MQKCKWGEGFLEEVATEVLHSGLRRRLGRIAIPAAHLSQGQVGWEGSFRDHRPTVSTNRGERPRRVPRALSCTDYPLPISCGRPLKSYFWQVGTGWHQPSHVRSRTLVQMGEAREEGGALITLAQPSAGTSHCQPIRLDPAPAPHPGFAPSLCPEGPANSCSSLKASAQEVAWPGPIQSCPNRYRNRLRAHDVPTQGQV